MRADKSDTSAVIIANEATQAPATIGALRTAALRLADTRKKPKLKTRDLVGFLLSHGARSWRASLPMINVRLKVSAPEGVAAVRLSLYRKSGMKSLA